MKKVKFKDGTFDIRKGFFKANYRYLDFVNKRFWWKINSFHILDCHVTESKVDSYLMKGNDYRITVK